MNGRMATIAQMFAAIFAAIIWLTAVIGISVVAVHFIVKFW